MMLPVLQVANSAAVGLFGMVLSCAFCPVKWERRNVLIMAVCAFGIFLVQGLLLFARRRKSTVWPIRSARICR